jgi:ribosomal protein S18 acetylase RimI-like enzyme
MPVGDCQTLQNPNHIEVQVRELRESDNLVLEWHGGRDLRSFYANQWFSHQSGDATVLIADCDGQPAGQAAIYWNGKPTHPQLPDVQSFRVHPDYQGRGIGTILLDTAAQVARQRGCHTLCLSVGVDNQGAKRLYERCGYRAVGQPYDDIWHYVNSAGETVRVVETVIDMKKDLT